MQRRVPVVAFVGKSDSGKTTVVEKVVTELVSRGWRVATVKHHVHDFDIDVPGKDSYRHAKAGASVSMVSSPDKFAVIRNVERELTLDEIADEARDVDILIAEGFKRTSRVRIEVSRSERSTGLISTAEELLGLVTDHASLPGVPTFDLEDANGVADLIERTFLVPDTAEQAEGTDRDGA